MLANQGKGKSFRVLIVLLLLGCLLPLQLARANTSCVCTLKGYGQEKNKVNSSDFLMGCGKYYGRFFETKDFYLCMYPIFLIPGITKKWNCSANANSSISKTIQSMIPAGTKTDGIVQYCQFDGKPVPRSGSYAEISGYGVSVMSTTTVLKAAQDKLNPASLKSPQQLIGYAIKFGMAVLGAIALGLYIWAGFLWMTSGGNSERRHKAMLTLIWVTFGIAVMFASYLAIKFIFEQVILK